MTQAVAAEPSPRLRAFLRPYLHRPLIHEHVAAFAAERAAGERVLDAGAGSAPYRELFGHCDYVTTDWEHSIYEEGRSADVVASLEDLPLEDGSFDAALATEVLEHVAEPIEALRELHRILAPGGALLVTTPFVWELHEEPHDYFRYTSHGLASLLGRAGFTDVRPHALNGYFTTLAQLVANYGTITGAAGAGGLQGRAAGVLARALPRMGPLVARLDARLDPRRGLPIGFVVSARRG